MPIIIDALPDRVILNFPPPAEKIGRFFVPEEAAMRPEMGELVAIGTATSERNKILRAQILEYRDKGYKFLIPMTIGTPLFRKELKSIADEYKVLDSMRVYPVDALAVVIRDGETEQLPTGTIIAE